MDKKTNRILSGRLVHYLVMAVCIVLLELGVFQALYSISHNYVLGTIVSFVTGVILNWIGGRLLIFGRSAQPAVREFLMVLAASIGGLLIQLGVVFVSVEVFHLYPLMGKLLSIGFSFFWNYYIRAAVIYRKREHTPLEDVF